MFLFLFFDLKKRITFVMSSAKDRQYKRKN